MERKGWPYQLNSEKKIIKFLLIFYSTSLISPSLPHEITQFFSRKLALVSIPFQCYFKRYGGNSNDQQQQKPLEDTQTHTHPHQNAQSEIDRLGILSTWIAIFYSGSFYYRRASKWKTVNNSFWMKWFSRPIKFSHLHKIMDEQRHSFAHTYTLD